MTINPSLIVHVKNDFHNYKRSKLLNWNFFLLQIIQKEKMLQQQQQDYQLNVV